MIVKTTSNLFITSSFTVAGFYQQLIGGMSSFQELGNSVVKIAEQAQAFRQYDRVKEAAQILANIPIKQYQTIGHYYLGLCEYRKGKSPKEMFRASCRIRTCKVSCSSHAFTRGNGGPQCKIMNPSFTG